jgi:hypothetical protein
MIVTTGQTHIRLTHKLINYLRPKLPQGETSHFDECQSQTYRNGSKTEISSFLLISVLCTQRTRFFLKSLFLCRMVDVKSPHDVTRFGQKKTDLTVRRHA